MRGLYVSRDLTIPLDFVTKTCAILAQRRKGKTYTASVLAEELVAAKMPFVALDPTGAWWGLRASADGKTEGLPVVIIGGPHGDLPLERNAGRLIADIVLDHPGYYVLDLKLLGSRAAEREFATDFGDRLHRRKMQPGMDFPLHLFIDEADMFVPQERERDEMKMLGVFQSIVRRGGLSGLGTTLISQRPALVNKSVLTQLDILILLRLVAGQDQDSVDKNYVSRAGSSEQRATLMGSLASLKLGEAWVWEPGAEPDPIFARVQIRERETFNSSATPKVGEKRAEPKRLAAVELAELKETMSETLERQAADDPVKLRDRIRTLEREVAMLQTTTPTERIEVPVITDEQWRGVEGLRSDLAVLQSRLGDATTLLAESIAGAKLAQPTEPVLTREPRKVPFPFGSLRSVSSPADIGASHRKILNALAWLEAVGIDEASRVTVGYLAGYTASGGTFQKYVSTLRTADLVDFPRPGLVTLTEAGRSLAEVPSAPLTDQALQEAFYARVGNSLAKILRHLVSIYPSEIDRESLGTAVGYEASGGTFQKYVSTLSSLGLVEYPSRGYVVASPSLFLR